MKYDSIAALLAAYINCYSTVVNDPAELPMPLAPAQEQEVSQTEIRIGKKLPPEYREFLLVSNGLRSGNFYHLYSTEMLESFYKNRDDDATMREVLNVAPFPGNVKLSQVTIIRGNVKNMTMSFIVSDPTVREYGHVFQWQMGIWDEALSLRAFLEDHIEEMCPGREDKR